MKTQFTSQCVHLGACTFT